MAEGQPWRSRELLGTRRGLCAHVRRAKDDKGPDSAMKTTKYFDYMRKRPDRAMIRDEWIAYVIGRPEKTEVQSDGRIRMWAWIPEARKFLRVILLEYGVTVHNAFFDRSYKENTQ